MRTIPLPHLVLVGLTTLSFVGCGAAGSQGSPPTSLGPSATAGPSPSLAPGAGAAPEALLVVGRNGEQGLHVIYASTGEVGVDLTAGSPTSAVSWERVMTATPDGDATVVRDTLLEPGLGGPGVRIDGHWQLPTIGLDPIPAGRSLDGSTVALVEGTYDPSARRSRFAIVEHQGAGGVTTAGDAPLRLVRIVDLSGAFEYDTLSPDGRILYVVQHLDRTAGGHYQVRAVDVGTGVMREAVVADKTESSEPMAGSPIAQVRRPNGLVLTLYRGPEHPFVHALMTPDAWAICIDLPATGSDDAAASLDWGLVSSPEPASVFAVNASLGLAVEIDPGGLAVRRSASLGTTGAAPIVFAKFGNGGVGPIGRRVVATPDRKLLFAAGRDGLTVIRTADLGVVRHDLVGSSIDALGIAPDGLTLFALLRGSGEIVALDPTTGRRLGTVPGQGYDRLLAVGPW